MTQPYPHDAKEHLELAARKLDAMRQRAMDPPGRLCTLNGMVDAWRELVAQIEDGYDESIDEYTNDLSVRQLLDELLDVLPAGTVRTWVTKEVTESDERYLRATHAVAEPIFGANEVPWLWRRVPTVLSGELRRDVEAVLGE
jgi:hypothetical protein